MRSVDEHRAEAPDTVRCMVITVSDTRTEATDTGGQLLQSLLTENGYQVIDYTIVKDSYVGIRELLHDAAERPEVEAILLTGGTGIAPQDVTFEAVQSLLTKELPGFGEIFRFLSFTEDIGSVGHYEPCDCRYYRRNCCLFDARFTRCGEVSDGTHYYS